MIFPVILCGGSGTRLWPMSRATFPKQFLPLVSEQTLLQETINRVTGAEFSAPLMISNEQHRFLVAEELRKSGVTHGKIVLEPVGRSSAPAATVAALIAQEQTPDAEILLLPSDHAIGDTQAFAKAITLAQQAAAAKRLVTFGISATAPETGYGYIQAGAPLDIKGAFEIDLFIEKPPLNDAKSMLEKGGFAWNSGMFMFKASVWLEEIQRHAPDMLAACRKALDKASRDHDFIRLGADAFAECPEGSVDVTVMEKTDLAAVIPVDMDWSDVGSWSKLWELGQLDSDHNLVVGDVIASEVSNSYLRSEGPLLAAIGIDNLVAVATEDAVLISTMDKVDDVKLIVEQLRQDQRPEYISHLKVHRPWGWYQGIGAGPGFQAKRICVAPGRRISLQYHERRSEHWTVVSGSAIVTRGDEVFELSANQSVHIPQRENHRLENPTSEPLHLIEVQCGDYFGEDDIVRLEDDYQRDQVT
ncbi:MAG: mannose-1-phosphate guanylyltransferase/mannose-6-phosphate isomerase [Alphaproteobacteria bacterium]|jgi:mannose-1-phosphate guanylyltransferase / mannose-6-phosphate isomerase|nr:mannose-1-phosphate guanylyltransferase/mannose-6-phosphate isomerase [Alphaproteobacteria bacterium]MBT4966817.1 mannose-1-phosphate guanylyltransferase/mannose-6-phosphate isomerase [Alphaproteobacteria bacterium]MBT5161590.1 mannose-1-phosphate guanylyltransferase/mannose-6-phosphate isomerase [Alphaproteobacteria bacterium]MBT5917078.1 mannose-1-phosphate guanylyltransferase/mannose-6-phosphate isomerase [Alphaproteobacteria bacterium]MBT6387632.1 mannose-1-phosphate guanylyltransferase/